MHDNEDPGDNFFNSNDVKSFDGESNTKFDYGIEFGQRTWFFTFESPTPAMTERDEMTLVLIPIAGFLMSFLLFSTLSYLNRNLQLTEQTQLQRTEFDAMISHELKTPLVPIKGYCEMLLEPKLIGDLNEEQQDVVKSVISSSEHLLTLVNRILLVQRLDMKKFNLVFEEISVQNLLKEIHQSHQGLTKDKNITLLNNNSKDIVMNTDKNQIREILTNIIQNAVDFVPNNTGKIQIDAKDNGNSVIFSISNNGPPIRQSDQKHLFKKFYQLDTSVTRNHGGAGLGLAICRGIVEGFGGKIWVDSKPDSDVVFSFEIPKNLEENSTKRI